MTPSESLFANLSITNFIPLTPTCADLFQMDDNKLGLMLRNEKNLGVGLEMRASVTGADGIAKSYSTHEGALRNNPSIKQFLKDLAEKLKLNLASPVGPVELIKMCVHPCGAHGLCRARLNHTFEGLETIATSTPNFKCDMFSIGKIANNTKSGRMSIMTSQTTVQDFRCGSGQLWRLLVACIAALSGATSMLSFDDTEKLVILS